MSTQYPIAVLNRKQICELIGIKPDTLTGWMQAGKFPRPDIQQSLKVQLWNRSTVDQWFADAQAAK